jgi:hypothetical protein
MEEGVQRFKEETQPRPISSIRLRAGRAVLNPKDGYVWQLLGARYRLPINIADKHTIAMQLANHPKAITVRLCDFDVSAMSVFGIPCSDFNCSIGVLVDESSVYGWSRAIRGASKQNKVCMHTLRLGPKPEYWVNVAVLVPEVVSHCVFLYSLASVASFGRLQSMVRDKKAFNDNVRWVGSLEDAGLKAEDIDDMLLICEHLVLRGF